MDILTSFNRDFEHMFLSTFVPNLPPKSNLYVRYVNGDVDRRFGVFYQKMEHVRDHILKNNDLTLFLDIDVAILDDNIITNLENIWNQRRPDLLMQWNQPGGFEKNIGVMLINPTLRVKELYIEYCNADSDWIIENYGFDQKFFNYLLRTSYKDLKVEILPLEFYGGQMRGYTPPPDNIQLYHATFERTKEDKESILKIYTERYREGL